MVESLITTDHCRVQKSYFDLKTNKVFESIYDIPGSKELNQQVVPIFLRTGFVPGNATLFKDIECLPGGAEIEIKEKAWEIKNQFRYEKLINCEKYEGQDDGNVARIGAELLVKIIDRNYSPGSTVIIPISGGLDSRGILAAALEVVEPENILSYTFGIPGSYDYEIGKLVAEKVGLKHVPFNLNQLEITEDRLVRAAILSNANTDLFQIVYLTYVFDEFGRDLEYWIGYLGGPLSGKHPVMEQDLDGNIRTFLCFNDYSKTDVNGYFDISKKYLLQNVLHENGYVLDQLDFYNRQERYISHQLFFDGYKFVNPLADEDFISFMLSIPPEKREHRYFYMKMLGSQFPELFSLPTKAMNGMPLTAWPISLWINDNLMKVKKKLKYKQKYMSLNYIDYDRAIVQRPDLNKIIKGKLTDLKNRDIISSQLIDDAWNNYTSAKSNGLYLTLLASLETIIDVFTN